MYLNLYSEKYSGHLTYFYVTGRGQFPFDMMRYDQCFPHSGEDAANLAEGWQWRTIKMVMVGKTNIGPTVERWRSFGWTVTDDRPSMSQIA